MTIFKIIVFGWLLGQPALAHAERLKDIADLAGARRNQLLGYGLVVGLPNTGDNYYAGLGMQSVANMLRYLGVNIDANQLRLQNVAAVMCTAEMPVFIAPGQRLDVVVSSMGNARSLEGGTLISTPLKGSDNKVYALAQGPLTVGGYFASGLSGSSYRRNLTTVGRIPNGASVEREVLVAPESAHIRITLKTPDFTTAVRLAQAVHQKMQSVYGKAPSNDPWAQAKNSGAVDVTMPTAKKIPVAEMMATLENVNVSVDSPARVVVNERTGTVVLGEAVRLTAVAVAHGSLTLEVAEQPLVSQPQSFGVGQTVVVPQSAINTSEGSGSLQALNPGASLGEVVKALNTLGVRPRDLIAILQALKTAGALRAELEVQ